VWKVSRISSGIVEHFYLFPTGVIAKTLSARKCSKITSETMWTGGLSGHRRTNLASSAWKILFLSLVVRWSPLGQPQHLRTALQRREFHWRVESLAKLGPVSFGGMFGDMCRITTVVLTQFVPQTICFVRHALILWLLLHGKQNPPTMADQCVFIRGFRAKRVLFWARRIRAAAEPRPDDPDNRREEVQTSRVAGALKVSVLPF
jgi:hypothetical protein